MSADITQAADTGMVERVARALALRASRHWAELGFGTSADFVEARWLGFVPDARAAIEAMREPTVPMVDSGVAFALNVSLGGDYRWSNYVADKHRAMIDAALGKPR